ncbi:MAG: hypothetical protein WBX25_12845 [Rhodomicrobium sp.]
MSEEFDILKAEIDAIMDPVKGLPEDDPRMVEAKAKAKPLAEKALAILRQERPFMFDLSHRPRGCCSRYPGYPWTVRIRYTPRWDKD